MYKSVYFKESDFNACSPSCSASDMQENVLIRLDIARHLFGAPIHLTSAYRSSDWDKAHGRSGIGAHTKGMAVDIYCTDINKRYYLVNALMRAGFFRIGIADTFIHADIDTSKKLGFWIYPAK